MNDYNSEILGQLNGIELYEILKFKCKEDSYGNQVLATSHKMIEYSYQRSKSIIKYMGQYTLHDSLHSFRVMKIADVLLPESCKRNMSISEIQLLILSCFYHDIGMAPDETEVISWKKVFEMDFNYFDVTDSQKEFRLFCDSHMYESNLVATFLDNGEKQNADNLIDLLVSDFIRINHAKWSKKIILKFKDIVRYKDRDLTRQLANLCESHVLDIEQVRNMECNVLCDSNNFLRIRFLAGILRLADILDFDAKRTPRSLYECLNISNPISLSEWQKHRAINAKHIDTNKVMFSAECSHPVIESNIRYFCELIQTEFTKVSYLFDNLLDENNNKLPESYQIKLPQKVDTSQIGPVKDILTNEPKYEYYNTKFTLSKTQIVDLLMGSKLYNDPRLALRELIQNSIDACLVRKELEKFWGNNYEPNISISYYQDEDEVYCLKVLDNGIGMDMNIINNFYSKIGSSYYMSKEFLELKSKANIDFKPISKFGIGILSAFMISDNLIVNTLKASRSTEKSNSLELRIEGTDSLFWIKKGSKSTVGTETILKLNKNNPWSTYTDQRIIDYIIKTNPRPILDLKVSANTISQIHSKSFFQSINLHKLADYKWRQDDNINLVEFKFNELIDNKYKLIGKALIGVLQDENSVPTLKFNLNNTYTTKTGEVLKFGLTYKSKNNQIESLGDQATLNSQGVLVKKRVYTRYAISHSQISLNGIEIPDTLFETTWRNLSTTQKIVWPFPVFVIMDISGKHPMNLNTSRSSFIYNDKFSEIKYHLACIILKKVKLRLNYNQFSVFVEKFYANTNETYIKKAIDKIYIKEDDNKPKNSRKRNRK